MEKLIKELDYRLNLCSSAATPQFAKTFYDQAFGAASLFMCLYPDRDDEVIRIWNTKYKPKFEKIVYGA